MEPGGRSSETGLREPSYLKMQNWAAGCHTGKTDLMEPGGKTSETGLRERQTGKTGMREPSCLKLQNWAEGVPNCKNGPDGAGRQN